MEDLNAVELVLPRSERGRQTLMVVPHHPPVTKGSCQPIRGLVRKKNTGRIEPRTGATMTGLTFHRESKLP